MPLAVPAGKAVDVLTAAVVAVVVVAAAVVGAVTVGALLLTAEDSKRLAARTVFPAALNLLRALKELTEELGVATVTSSGSLSAGGGGGPSNRDWKEVEALLFSGWGGGGFYYTIKDASGRVKLE